MKENIDIQTVDKITSITLSGHLDAVMASDCNEKILKVLEYDNLNVIFDLKELEYISSAGLRLFLYAAKKTKEKKGEVAFCSISDNVQRIFRLSGLNTIFSVYENFEKASTAINDAIKVE